MSDRRRDLAAWADACLEMRMKPLFAFTGPAGVPHSEFVRHGRASTIVQDVADDQMGSWARIWRAQTASAKAALDMVEGAAAGLDSYMLRHLEDFDSTAELMEDLRRLPQASLPVPGIAEVRAAAKRFRWDIGQGADRLAPRAISRRRSRGAPCPAA
eukprot:1726328-Pyramimonas_sp.AAC.1